MAFTDGSTFGVCLCPQKPDALKSEPSIAHLVQEVQDWLKLWRSYVNGCGWEYGSLPLLWKSPGLPYHLFPFYLDFLEPFLGFITSAKRQRQTQGVIKLSYKGWRLLFLVSRSYIPSTISIWKIKFWLSDKIMRKEIKSISRWMNG